MRVGEGTSPLSDTELNPTRVAKWLVMASGIWWGFESPMAHRSSSGRRLRSKVSWALMSTGSQVSSGAMAWRSDLIIWAGWVMSWMQPNAVSRRAGSMRPRPTR
jgi:hypothetical protein